MIRSLITSVNRDVIKAFMPVDTAKPVILWVGLRKIGWRTLPVGCVLSTPTTSLSSSSGVTDQEDGNYDRIGSLIGRTISPTAETSNSTNTKLGQRIPFSESSDR